MHTSNPITLHGLIAATHTPLDNSGALNPAMVEKQAAHLLAQDVGTAFINGTTGESHSLTLAERRQLAERWIAVTRGTPLRVVVHVGSNCLADARALAAQAESLGAAAIAANAPCYFRPQNLDLLIACCGEIAAGAPHTPFYFYDIPMLTGVNLPMAEFLARGSERIPTLRGLKFTNPDLMAYQLCLRAEGEFDVPWGMDEYLLGALAVGAKGAVGSSYNFAAPVYHRLIKAFQAGDLPTAQAEQFRSVRLVKLLAGYGYMGAAKVVMKMLGVDVGPARLPLGNLSSDQVLRLRKELDQLGFFDWIVQKTAR
ncbi:MAG TPA: dihydrodipicolinate synthase family protein [Verrucomicrobiae bacterium]